MILSEKEVKRIRDTLQRIRNAEIKGARRHFYTNQVNSISVILNRAERREKGTLL